MVMEVIAGPFKSETWRKLATEVESIDDSLGLRLITYDRDTRELAGAHPESLDDVVPQGEITDLSAAAMGTIQSAGGQPIAGVVLIGDGTQTAPIQGTGAQRVVETLNSLGIPLWTIPVGPAAGDSSSRDAAIDSLPESFQLFAGNQVDIPFQFVSRGLTGIDVPVQLTWIDADGEETEFATRHVAPKQSSATTAMIVSTISPAPGTYRLRVEALPQDGELVTTNNVQTSFVDVREGGGRILYLEGTARLEQTFLRRSLRRFQDLDLTFRWIPSDTSDRWPADLGDLLEPGKFDIYILGDLPAGALGEKQLTQLAEAIAGGAGLITLGGRRSYEGGAYASSPLAAAMPVKMNPSIRPFSNANTSNDDQTQLEGPLELVLAKQHPITDLGGSDPSAIWSELPKLLGANRFTDVKVAPGVQTLLTSKDESPLLVIGQHVRGRTAALAIDSTWRWWRGGKSEVHRRFWRQLVLWLLAREESSGDKIVIEIDARRFSVDQQPEFRASVQTLGSETVQVDLAAEVVDNDGTSMPLKVSTENRSSNSVNSSDAIRGKLDELKPGFYRLRVRPTSEGSQVEAAELAFQVVDESRELALPMADPVYLRQLAQLTSEHGGAAFDPEQVDDLIEIVKQRRKRAEAPVVEKFRLGDDPISGWILFGLFTGALTTEWFLRRRWGLA